ncbi:LysE family translocator [Pseudopedobacter beijingensis]|uniref:LysE family translocator n=1 Tax=Pseudopedobacter beijingensis TaxID=1207056 RepID=A0ABW4IIT9_9SPHI
MLKLIFSGIGLGIVLSFLTGPAFFALIKISIEKGFRAGVFLALGIVVSDAIYLFITLFGSSFLNFENQYRIPIGITGSLILLGIGSFYLFKKVKINYQEITCPKKSLGYFLKGFFMCIFNPFILLYWISVTSGIYSLNGSVKHAELLPFFGSILLTLFGMDVLKAYFAYRLRYRITEKSIQRLNRIAGTIIIIFAFRLIYNLIFTQSLI